MKQSEIINKILAGELLEFSCQGENYLIQQENNKGWDYISVWRISDRPVCLARTLFDLFDGLGEEDVLDLINQKCIFGRSTAEILEEIP